MLIRLPSGAVAPLEVPDLSALLPAGGDLAAIAAASFTHEEVEVDELLESDRRFIAEWALAEFCETDEALHLAMVSSCWSRSPAAALSLTDPPLAWALDRTLYLRLDAYEAQDPAERELLRRIEAQQAEDVAEEAPA